MTNKEQIASKCECYIPETKSCSKTLSGSCRGEMCQTFNLINQLAQSAIEDYRQTIERLQKECTEKTNAIIALGEQLKAEEQECEELKKQLMQKSEVDMFFNTPIEGWSNDPCGICPHKAENEELKKCYKNNSALLDFEETNTTKLVNKVMKLEKTLTEIKEIAEPFCNACQEFEPKKNDSNCMYCNYGKILQKISECEVNND